MGVPNMLNTIMKTAHDLLLNTVFYLMGICVITGAIGRLFVEFGVVSLLEKLLRPLMRPLFNLPGVASLGAVMTFLSDNPAIISLSQDKRFSSYFKKYQFISLTNFGTAFGMGLLVMVFMVGQGFYIEPLIGLFGAFVGCIVSTRLMQRKILKAYPQYAEEQVCDPHEVEEEEQKEEQKSLFLRTLNSLLDGGRTGVDIGIAIIPGVLIISTLVMMLTFGAGANGYDGSPYQGVELLPWLANKIDFLFAWLFGLENNIYMQTGLIMIIGLLAKTAILLTEYAGKRRSEGMTLAQAAYSAAKVRLRPILMTVLSMVFGLVPLMMAHGVGANGSRSLATGVIGGMIVGTLALLFLVPSLFIVFQYIQERVKHN